MIGRLPTALDVGGVECAIDADYRNVLTIIEAFEDEALTNRDKLFICLRRLYDEMPTDTEAAYKAAMEFIDAGRSKDNKPHPRLIDWNQDESLIFSAINKVAGAEVRAADFLHWFTFLGYFMEVGEGVWSTVLSIRQKKAKGKKLEKWEQEFYNSNKDLCKLRRAHSGSTKESLASAFDALVERRQR